jgi:predicted alpha/beta superfamily hydrolase
MYKKLVLLLVITFPLFCFAQKPTPSSGKIKHYKNFKSNFIIPRNVDVWLPEDYNKNEKYAVLYLQDGQSMFDSAVSYEKSEVGVDETISKLIKDGIIKKCIVVAIWNTMKIRHSEYMPQKPFETFDQKIQDSFYTVKLDKDPMLQHKVQSDNYLKFLVTELKPFIDKKYSTLTTQENTFIGGYSMGGLISVYAMCEYPNVFGGVACLSTWWPGLLPNKKTDLFDAFAIYVQNNLPSPINHKLYFDYGTVRIDYFIKALQLKIDAIAIAKGYTTANFISKEFKGGDHMAKDWRSRFNIPVTFLLGK